MVQKKESLSHTFKTVTKLGLELLFQPQESGLDDLWLLLLVMLNLISQIMSLDVFGVILLILTEVKVREKVLLKIVEIDSLFVIIE